MFGTGNFRCDESGFVRAWLVCGPSIRPYDGPPADEGTLKIEALDKRIIDPPEEVAHGRAGLAGHPWRYYHGGQNVLVEVSDFYPHPVLLDFRGQTLLECPRVMDLPAKLWAAGTADLWLNGRHMGSQVVGQLPAVDSGTVVLPLRSGVNRLDVRVQAFGARDTRHLFGVQVLENHQDLRIRLPGDGEGALTDLLARCEQWLGRLRVTRSQVVAEDQEPPVLAVVQALQERIDWPEEATRVDLPAGTVRLTVALAPADERLVRTLEIPSNRCICLPPRRPIAQHREAIARQLSEIDLVAAHSPPGQIRKAIMPLIVRAADGTWRTGADDQLVDELCDYTDSRADCADFVLAGLLRVFLKGNLQDLVRERIRHTALAFRYWPDEAGSDAMWFWSENHSLLFHGCQMIAGATFPMAQFGAGGRSGAQQRQVGLERCAAWLDKVESIGLYEYLSSPYMPVTAAALTNLVDFSPDEGISRRASGVLDEMFRLLAMHAFDGVVIGPQGRVYRDVLYPDETGRQALLSYATTDAVEATSEWLSFLVTSSYRPPAGLEDSMARPIRRRYRQAYAEIVLEKTAGYCLSSLVIPSTIEGLGPKALWPGKAGYQQQVWIASLAKDCLVFVNHPGATFDLSIARPGYWYGNGSIPAVSQREGWLSATWDIGPEHLAGFTHAHWPADAFDEQEVGDHWAFGRRAKGYVGLWCSRELRPHDDVLIGRELRAMGRHVAWLCFCGQADQQSFEDFRQHCRFAARAWAND